MAQTSSAQREPSMEEILASIRRIIEDSDSVRQPLEEAEAQFSSPIADPGTIQLQVEAFRADLEEVEPMRPDIFIPPVTIGTEPETPETAEMPAVMAAPSAPQIPLDMPLASFDVPEPDEMPAEVEAHFAEVEEAPVKPSAELAESRASLISDQAGRQVAAAFGELSEAFAASRRRSFDEMAEEMLRPMLQDWLDNNLPVLVERLVREEIERVARGS